jgi:hypothetical protein
MSQSHARAPAWADEDLKPRRTVQITGHPDKAVARPARPTAARPATSRHLRLVEVDRRRPPRRPVERLGGRPDRIAMWALVMALFLILVTVVLPH